MDFLAVLETLPHSILLWRILTIFFAALFLYMLPAAYAYWVNQRTVEENIEKIVKDISNTTEFKEFSEKQLLNILSEYKEIKDNNKNILEELKNLKEAFASHSTKTESFIEKIEFLLSIKSDVDENDNLFKIINKLQQKKRRIDRY